MRKGLFLGIGVLLVLAGAARAAQEPQPMARYGVNLNLRVYPQATPKDALNSVLLAIDNNRIDYLLAHLSDPDFVDKRVKELYRGRFEDLVAETTMKLADNPATAKELRRFLKEGEWEEAETGATVKLKDVKDRQVFLRKLGNRWFLENRQKPESSNSKGQ